MTMHMLNKQIGKNLKTRRKYYNLTQENVAEYLNISVGYLGSVERGDGGLRLIKLLELSKLYNCTVEDLIGINIHHYNTNNYNDECLNKFMIKLKILNFNNKKELDLLIEILSLISESIN